MSIRCLLGFHDEGDLVPDSHGDGFADALDGNHYRECSRCKRRTRWYKPSLALQPK